MEKISTPTIEDVTVPDNLKEMMKAKEIDEEEPSERVISNLLNYSKVLSVRKSIYLDQIELILN